MTFEDLLTEVYRLCEDEGQFAWTNKAVARHCTDAIRRISTASGGDTKRLTMALVDGQSEYSLVSGVRKVNAVKILPEAGTEPAAFPLKQLRGDQMPVVEEDGDPEYFTLNMTGGTNEDRFVLDFHPTPDRSAADSIIVDYEGEYTIESDNPASVAQKAVELPYPSMFQTVLVNYTAGAMLNESDDPADQTKGRNLVAEAQSHIRALAFYRATTAMIDYDRIFP